MNRNDENQSNAAPERKKKKTYVKPKIQSDKLNSYGALCNGTTTAGRKASVTGPSFCNAGRLNS